jgi:D-alanyl-D-alanine carboxypeptidase
MNRKTLPVVFLPLLVAAAQAQDRQRSALEPALRRIDEFVAGEMQRAGTPGLALALVDRSGVISVRTYGYADIERRVPVTPSTRFEIGSISKSFTAIALLQLQGEGRFEPAFPVRHYLSWFTPRSRWRPVTAHDLLTHTAGLPADRDDIPSSPAQAFLVRERTLGSAPGTRWAYSNVGFQVLGVLLETLDGAPYPAIIQRRILDPLAMGSTAASFTSETRPGLARGYRTLYDDRPARTTDPLVPAEWIEYGSGDGSIVATAPDLGRYLTMLLNEGQGPRGPIVPAAGFKTLMTAQARTAPDGDGYGYGMFLGTLDDRPVFYHGGAMLGYTSYLIGEPGSRIGAVAFVNGPGSPSRVARFALQALGAVMRGDTLPAIPLAPGPYHVETAEAYAGVFHSATGDSLVFAASGDSLLLMRPNRADVLEVYGKDSFLGPAPDFALFPIRFGRGAREIEAVWYGGDYYVRTGVATPRTRPAPRGWQAFVGHYRIMQPWEPDFRVVLRQGRLLWVGPDGDEQPLTPLGSAEFRVGDPGSAERLRFDMLLNGRALRAVYSGMAYYRDFTP